MRAQPAVAARSRAALVALALAPALPAQALTIDFDYRYDTRGFFTAADGTPIAERRDVLEAAAAAYAGFSDALTAVAPAAGDHWSVSFTYPSLGQPPVTWADGSIAADTITVFVGGSPSAPGVLGFSSIGSGLKATGSAAFVDSVLTRGQPNARGATASDYGPWGGMIWFNASADWSFDLAGPVAGHNDFYTTAVHELGHILGYGEADSWAAQIDAQGRFTGAQSMAVYGGPVPLDQYGAHWAPNTLSITPAGQVQGTLMDPSTAAGVREVMTVLDLAGFADIGWQVSAVPEPTTWLLWGAGLAALALQRSSARRAGGGSAAARSARKASALA